MKEQGHSIETIERLLPSDARVLKQRVPALAGTKAVMFHSDSLLSEPHDVSVLNARLQAQEIDGHSTAQQLDLMVVLLEQERAATEEAQALLAQERISTLSAVADSRNLRSEKAALQAELQKALSAADELNAAHAATEVCMTALQNDLFSAEVCTAATLLTCPSSHLPIFSTAHLLA
jgi:hypothetical protein